MICPHIKFQESSLNGILIITIKPNIKYRFHAADISVFVRISVNLFYSLMVHAVA